MILRFEVDQAEAFRQGVNVEKSTNHIDVDPAKLTPEERSLIADRLDGIDVRRLEVEGNPVRVEGKLSSDLSFRKTPVRPMDSTKGRIVAKLPTYEALIEAIRQNQVKLETDCKGQGQSFSQRMAEVQNRKDARAKK